MPRSLAKEIDKIARREKIAFSAAVAMLAEEGIRNRRSIAKAFRSFGAGASSISKIGPNQGKYFDHISRDDPQ